MTKVLHDIKQKKHDKKVCHTNCTANGDTFNQIPHQCKYYSGSPGYKRLLKYHKISHAAASGGSGTSSNESIKDFCLQLILLEDYKEEFSFGCRKEEDIIEVQNAIETLWVF